MPKKEIKETTMDEKYDNLHSLGEDLYTQGSPVIIKNGEILLDTENGKNFASLTFQNIDKRTIASLSIVIKTASSSGKSIYDEGAESGKNVYTYQNVDAEQGEFFGTDELIPISEASSNDFIIILKEAEFFEEGRETIDYEFYPLPSPTPIEKVLDSEEARQAYFDKFGEDAVFKAERISDLWRCSCGCLNKEDEPECISCWNDLSQMLSIDQIELESEYRRKKEIAQAKTENARYILNEERKAYIPCLITSIVSVLLMSVLTFIVLRNGGHNWSEKVLIPTIGFKGFFDKIPFVISSAISVVIMLMSFIFMIKEEGFDFEAVVGFIIGSVFIICILSFVVRLIIALLGYLLSLCINQYFILVLGLASVVTIFIFGRKQTLKKNRVKLWINIFIVVLLTAVIFCFANEYIYIKY